MTDTFQGQINSHPDHERSMTLFKVTTWNKAVPIKLSNQQQRDTVASSELSNSS